MNKDETQKKIGELVERFGEQIDSYKKSDYLIRHIHQNETNKTNYTHN